MSEQTCTDTLTYAEVMRDRDPLIDTTLQELFDAERPKHASAEATWAAIAGRAIGAYAVAQAERDHLRRALEWTIATMQGADKYECPRPCPEGQHDEDGRCIGTLEGCWNITALAATEEGSDAE